MLAGCFSSRQSPPSYAFTAHNSQLTAHSSLISDRFLTSCRGDSVAWSGGPVQFAEGFAEAAEEIFQLAGEGEELESFVDALVESCRARRVDAGRDAATLGGGANFGDSLDHA